MKLIDKLFGRSSTVTFGKQCFRNSNGKDLLHSQGRNHEYPYVRSAGCGFLLRPASLPACPLRGRGSQILTGFIPETGVGYHAKNREIKKGYSPINQVFK